MSKYYIPLESDKIYHLFSRAVGNEALFLSDENYLYFLRKLKHHTASVCDVYCYTLLPNHFHLVVQIKSENDLIKAFTDIKKLDFDESIHSLTDFVMERFSNLLNSYTKSFNKMFDRKGALFMDYLKRSVVLKDMDLSNFIWYVHKNAVHHGITNKIGEWQFDSYNSIISSRPTNLKRNEIIDWFGSEAAFIRFHQQKIERKITEEP